MVQDTLIWVITELTTRIRILYYQDLIICQMPICFLWKHSEMHTLWDTEEIQYNLPRSEVLI